MIPYLPPFESVGPIQLGDRLSYYSYPFQLLLEDKEYGDTYELEDESLSVVITEDEIIETITCEEEFLFKGVNLIGLDYEVFLSHMCLENVYEADSLDFIENEPPQQVYCIDEFGLMVWAKEGTIVTIIVSNIDDD